MPEPQDHRGGTHAGRNVSSACTVMMGSDRDSQQDDGQAVLLREGLKSAQMRQGGALQTGFPSVKRLL